MLQKNKIWPGEILLIVRFRHPEILQALLSVGHFVKH